MYGDIEVARQGDAGRGPYSVLFRPFNQAAASGQSHTLANEEALKAFLHTLGLPDSEISKLSAGLEGFASCWVRTLVPTATLKQYRLI
jgi:hypothetical protein